MVAETMGGRMYVRHDQTGQATPHGQVAFFAEFLATAGVFDRWVQACPLHYSSASRARDTRPLDDAAGLYLSEHRRSNGAANPTTGLRCAKVTAAFKFIR